MTPLAIVSGLTAVLLVATFALLCVLAIWDCRRTFKRIDDAHPQHVEPSDFSGAIKVRDRTRRGPEPIDHHHSKKRVGL